MTNAANHDQKAAHAAAVQIVPLRLAHHEDPAANVVHSATDLKQIGQRDQNEVTATKPAAQVVAARKHHQNPVALVEAQTKTDAAMARIADIVKADRKLVRTVQVAIDLVWIAAPDIVPLSLLSEDLAADDPILMLTHGTVAQVIDDRALARQGVITEYSSVRTTATSVTADPALDLMRADMGVFIPGSIHVTARCTAGSAHKAVITGNSSVHTTVTSDMVDPTLDTMPVDTVVAIPGSISNSVQCTTDLAREAVITDRSLGHTAATSVTVDSTSDIMSADMVVIIPGSIHAMVRCFNVDSAHKAAITVRNSVHAALASVMVDPTSDIMQVDTAINRTLILVHDTVARCLDIISDHEAATAHISAHAV